MNAVAAHSQGTDPSITFCHPKWPDIRGEIENVFVVDKIRDWAIRAVIAHQYAERTIYRNAVRVIGQDAAIRLRTLCKKYRIDLPPIID